MRVDFVIIVINKKYMREIKFRAYNRDWNMTLPVDEIKFENGEAVSVSVTIKASDYDHKGEWADYIVGDEITIEQFTGLKDKNGKEIYEGDILKYEETGSFGVMTWLEKTAQFGFSNGWANPVYGYTNVNEAVIIGNIFENPELIN